MFVQNSRLITPVVFVPLLYLFRTQGWSRLLHLSLCCICPVLKVDPTSVAFVQYKVDTTSITFVQYSRLILRKLYLPRTQDWIYLCCMFPTKGWHYLHCICSVLKVDPSTTVFVQYSRLTPPLLYLSSTLGWSYLCCICPDLKVDPTCCICPLLTDHSRASRVDDSTGQKMKSVFFSIHMYWVACIVSSLQTHTTPMVVNPDFFFFFNWAYLPIILIFLTTFFSPAYHLLLLQHPVNPIWLFFFFFFY